jgi:broad specificity phosphatase PhoE
MVGLPARGKSYTGRKIERYLSWLGYATRVFNVGEYRRARVGAHMQHEFFDPDNVEGSEARRAIAMEALDDLVEWLSAEGEVAIYDATNSTSERRAEVRTRCESAGCTVLFIEIVCDDPAIIEANIRTTKLDSPDYANVDAEEAVRDFRARIEHYERAYEPLSDSEGAYVRVLNAGKQLHTHAVAGYLAARVVFFLMNLHLSDRQIWITRHGESAYNALGLLGGDPELTPRGKQYAKELAGHIDAAFPASDAVSVWTSSLRRAVETGRIVGRKLRSFRALDEINAGICDGMTYELIKERMPDEYAARKADKLRYRYPRGESYQDVITRLDPVIIELERTRRPVLVIAHNAVARALYAYLHGIPPEACPHLDIPLHTVIRMSPHAYGIREDRVELDPIHLSSG